MRLTPSEARALRLLERHGSLVLHRGNRWSHGVYNVQEGAHRGAHYRTIASLNRKRLVRVDKVSNTRNAVRLTAAGRAEILRRLAL
jgi:DNA-binding PadR family transcriptional regulator